MAGKALIPVGGSSSTFALNQVLAAFSVEAEVEHIATTLLAMLPAPTPKERPREAKKGSADPLVWPHLEEANLTPRSAPRSTKSSASKKGRGVHSNTAQRPSTGELRLKEVGKCLFDDPLPPFPLEAGQLYLHFVKTKSGNVVSHNYTTIGTNTPDSSTPQQRFYVVGIRTPGGGYGKGLMTGPSPKRKEKDKSVDSSPTASKVWHYESKVEKVLKGPKVI